MMRQERKPLKRPYNVWKDSKNLTLSALRSDKACFSWSTRDDAAEGVRKMGGIYRSPRILVSGTGTTRWRCNDRYVPNGRLQTRRPSFYNTQKSGQDRDPHDDEGKTQSMF